MSSICIASLHRLFGLLYTYSFLRIIFIIFIYVWTVTAYMSTGAVESRGAVSPGARITYNCKLPHMDAGTHGCWKQNSGPLEV